MKKIAYMIAGLCALITFVSCDDFLNITPEGQVSGSEQLSTAKGIEDAMYGAYAQMRSTSLYGQELHFSALEVMSHTLWCKGNTVATELGKFNYTHSDVESVFEQVWTKMYNNIMNVNSVLSSPLLANLSPGDFPYCIYRGEALGLRAFMHFDLVRMFAEQYTNNPDADGIPYADAFSLDTPDFESLADNYKHIIADLLEAERLLDCEDEYENSTPYMSDRRIHINKYAVQALLARVYFTMGDADKAAEYAHKVIDAGKYTLIDSKDFTDRGIRGVLFNGECLFGIYDAGFYEQANAKLEQTQSFYSLNLRSDYAELYEIDLGGRTDVRKAAYFGEAKLGDATEPRLSKFTNYYESINNPSARPKDDIPGINLIRLPEMYYILSEIYLAKSKNITFGGVGEAVDDATVPVVDSVMYNKAVACYDSVRVHRGLAGIDKLEVKSLTLQRICEERDKEYIGEGQKFFNLKRLNRPITAYDGKTVYQAGNGIYVIPIPEIEFENRD